MAELREMLVAKRLDDSYECYDACCEEYEGKRWRSRRQVFTMQWQTRQEVAKTPRF